VAIIRKHKYEQMMGNANDFSAHITKRWESTRIFFPCIEENCD
jgi:hypothetical protein